MAFLCRLTGRRARPWFLAGYLLLLSGIHWTCAAAGWYTPPAAALLALYGMSRLILKNRSAQSWTAAVLAVYVCQLAAGMVNSLEAMAAPGLPKGWPLYVLVSLAAFAVPALCAVCYALVLRLLALEEDAPCLEL